MSDLTNYVVNGKVDLERLAKDLTAVLADDIEVGEVVFDVVDEATVYFNGTPVSVYFEVGERVYFDVCRDPEYYGCSNPYDAPDPVSATNSEGVTTFAELTKAVKRVFAQIRAEAEAEIYEVMDDSRFNEWGRGL